MIVKLVNWTPKPLETVLFAYNAQRERKIEPDLTKLDKKEAEWTTRQLIKDGLSGPLEFVSTVWFFDGVSRAFQQQLTRHRLFGFAIQSMRVVDKREFADKRQYLVPDDCVDKKYYRHTMMEIQKLYNILLDCEEPVQVARGILPMNIFSPITMVANMRGLLDMFRQRMCLQVQGEFRDVVVRMMAEIKWKMSGVFLENLKEPCRTTGRCQMSLENELRIQGKDALGRKPCPLYKNVRGAK